MGTRPKSDRSEATAGRVKSAQSFVGSHVSPCPRSYLFSLNARLPGLQLTASHFKADWIAFDCTWLSLIGELDLDLFSSKLTSFHDRPPFTLQRMCELLCHPELYSTTDKFFAAFSKVRVRSPGLITPTWSPQTVIGIRTFHDDNFGDDSSGLAGFGFGFGLMSQESQSAFMDLADAPDSGASLTLGSGMGADLGAGLASWSAAWTAWTQQTQTSSLT